MKKMNAHLILFALAGLLAFVGHESIPSNDEFKARAEISAQEYLDNIRILASDEMGGRGNGTEELDRAAELIRDNFRSAGLESLGEDYFQQFEIQTGNEFGPGNAVTMGAGDSIINLKLGETYVPVSMGGDAAEDRNIVFAGYGITAPDFKYDDYENVDVENDIVLILALEPQRDNKDSVFEGTADTGHAQIQSKVLNARKQGAAGAIIVKGPLNIKEGVDELPRLVPGYIVPEMGIPAVVTTFAEIESFLKSAGLDILEIQKGVDEDLKPRSRELTGAKATMRIDATPVMKMARNVVGMVRGSDPNVQDEVIVVGAHYDHIGLGYRNSNTPAQAGQVHNGADDNASGTSGLLEIAEYFGLSGNKPRRTLVFVAFTGEEWGILGSTRFVDHPLVPLNNIAAMVNMDMIGRMQNDRMTVGGIGTAEGFRALIESVNGEFNFDINYDTSGIASSDHAAFTIKKIPSLFFFTGVHPDYHSPGDDWEKINAEKGSEVSLFAARAVEKLDAMESRPQFVEVKRTPPPAGRGGGARPWFGSVPDFSFKGEGYRFQAVSAGSPAEAAGLMGGDILVRFGGKKISNIYDYTSALGAYQPGDDVEVTVLRDGEEVTVTVKLTRRQ